MESNINCEIAEILGMFAADGCLQPRYVCMWGNINQDKDYYDNIVCPLFSKVFGKTITAHEKRSNSVYGFYLCGKGIVEFFRQYGFNVGKKTHTVEVPKIILESDNLKLFASFIRGLVDSDGCINFLRRTGNYSEFKRKFHTYPRIFIGSVSRRIIKDVSYMLVKLKIKHTLERKDTSNCKKNKSDVFLIVIRGEERMGRWMSFIGFNNPVQFTKYEIWKMYGFCPSNTTLEQRKLILKQELDPKPLSV